MALLFLKYRLNKLPLDEISPRDASKYRLICARFLLGPTEKKAEILRTFGGDIGAVLQYSLSLRN